MGALETGRPDRIAGQTGLAGAEPLPLLFEAGPFDT
jgi:hypothetical protein